MTRIFTTTFILFFFGVVKAEPYFVDPLLASTGLVVPLGHLKIRTFGTFNNDIAKYDDKSKITHVPIIITDQINPQITYGLTNNMDTQLNLPYSFVYKLGNRTEHMGDISLRVGYQACKQKAGTLLPNLRLSVRETFPTGRFAVANPLDRGAGFTGFGSYQTAFGFDYERIIPLSSVHYSRSRFVMVYQVAHPVSLHGISVHGGSPTTRGVLAQGNIATANLSEEVSLTEHWIAAMEIYYLEQQPSQFRGTTGIDSNGEPARVGHLALKALSLAPAIEYGFSEHLGLTGGVWFSVKGRNAPVFVSTVILLRAFW